MTSKVRKKRRRTENCSKEQFVECWVFQLPCLWFSKWKKVEVEVAQYYWEYHQIQECHWLITLIGNTALKFCWEMWNKLLRKRRRIKNCSKNQFIEFWLFQLPCLWFSKWKRKVKVEVAQYYWEYHQIQECHWLVTLIGNLHTAKCEKRETNCWAKLRRKLKTIVCTVKVYNQFQKNFKLQ